MSAAAVPAKYVEGMRLTERERAVLIDQMKKSGVADRRKSPRIVADGNFSVLLTMDSPGGNSAHFRIYPWDLSRGGLGFFHRAFVYPGTRCTFTGLTFGGLPFTIKGEVVRCSHVSGSVHTVGTKLDAEIDPDELLGAHAADNLSVNEKSPRVDDWWTQIGSHTCELSKLARDKAAPDVIRKCIASLVQHASTQPAAAPAAPFATRSAA
jgi:hypothetical protein